MASIDVESLVHSVPFRPAVRPSRRSVRSPLRGTRGMSAAFCALTLAGCASYEARPLAPEVEFTRLRGATVDDLRIEYTTPAAPTTARFDPTDGLDEAELAAVALTLNARLRAKRAAIGEVRALLVTAGTLPNPDLGAFVRPGISGNSGTGVGLDALFFLLRPDERDAKRALAEANVDLVRAEIEAVELDLVSDVRRGRIRLLTAEQTARLVEQELALRDEAVRLVRRQRELGETTDIALALVELDATSLQRQARLARAAVESERAALNALIGVPPTLDLTLVGDGSDLTFAIVPDPTDDALDARLIAGSGGLRTRASEYARAEQELRLAVARQYPRIGIGPSYEKDVEGSEGLGLGASIEVPLFDRNQGEIAEKLAHRERVRGEYVAELHELRARAFAARAQQRSARLDVESLQRDVVPLIERTEALFESALRARELSVFEWLTARTRAIQSRRDLLDALARYASAAVELDAATGTPLVTVLTEKSGEERAR